MYYLTSPQGGKVVFTAGQIGLQPANMNMVPPTNQPSVSLAHVTSVLEANHTHLGSAICGVCYYTTEEAGWAARMAWRQVTHTRTHTQFCMQTHPVIHAALAAARWVWPSCSVPESTSLATRGLRGVELHSTNLPLPAAL